jgi:uncharacterized protein
VWRTAAEANIGMIAMKVYGGAHDAPPKVLSHSKMPLEYHDIAFRYALSLPKVACAVIGMVTPRELRQNLLRAKRFQPLSADDMRRLQSAGMQLARRWNDHLGPVT